MEDSNRDISKNNVKNHNKSSSEPQVPGYQEGLFSFKITRFFWYDSFAPRVVDRLQMGASRRRVSK